MSRPFSLFLALLFGMLLPGWDSARAEPSGLEARVMLAVADELPVSSQIDGRIATLILRGGDRFKKGQSLVGMDCRVQKAREKKAKAELNGARRILAAKQRLLRLNSGSRMGADQAAADVAKAEADLEVIRAVLEMCVLRAPFDGIVVTRLAVAHQYVTKGQPILEIIDDSTLQAHLIVPSTWLLWLQEKLPFSFRLDETGKVYSARIRRIGVRVDPASQTVAILGDLDAPSPELRPGMGGVALFSPPPETP